MFPLFRRPNSLFIMRLVPYYCLLDYFINFIIFLSLLFSATRIYIFPFAVLLVNQSARLYFPLILYKEPFGLCLLQKASIFRKHQSPLSLRNLLQDLKVAVNSIGWFL